MGAYRIPGSAEKGAIRAAHPYYVKYYTIIDFNEVDIRIYLPEKVIIY